MKQLEIYKIAKLEDGVKEFSPGSNPRIEEYHATTTFGKHSDEFPWCSSFVNWCCTKAGVKGTNSAAANSWLNWGVPVEIPQVGDIVILSRGSSKSQAHVAFFEGVSKAVPMQTVKLFGGNQGDAVCSKWFPASQVLGYRRTKE